MAGTTRRARDDNPARPHRHMPVLAAAGGQARLELDGPAVALRDIVLRTGTAQRRALQGSLLALGAARLRAGRWRSAAAEGRTHFFRRSRACVSHTDPAAELTLQGYWTVSRPARTQGALQLDLEVLLQTTRLRDVAGATVSSRFEWDELLAPAGREGQSVKVAPSGASPAHSEDVSLFLPPAVPADAALAAEPRQATKRLADLFGAPIEEGPVCRRPLLIARLPGSELSYVEMCHPAGWCGVVVRGTRGGAALHWLLFFRELEKGVILRGRVRGVFVPRDKDIQAADELYAALLAEPPPLSA